MENLQITKVVRPPSLLRSKCEATGLSMLNSYLCMKTICLFCIKFDVLDVPETPDQGKAPICAY